jgi:hypothetical protein
MRRIVHRISGRILACAVIATFVALILAAVVAFVAYMINFDEFAFRVGFAWFWAITFTIGIVGTVFNLFRAAYYAIRLSVSMVDVHEAIVVHKLNLRMARIVYDHERDMMVRRRP